MNRVQIKETAKNLLKKNHWLCVGVGLIVNFLGYINIDLSRNGDAYSEILNNFELSDIINSNLYDIFSEAQAHTVNTNSITKILLLIASLAVTTLLTVFVSNQILVGARRFFLKYRKNHPVEVAELFKSYTDKTFLNVAKVTFIKDLSVFLWSMLCIVPGIMKAYEYAAVEYILSVNPTMEYSRALDLSRRVMNGHKMELFELHISFLGWHILSLFTCGLLSILYVQPYQLIAEAEFFSYVREIAIFNGVISYNDIPDYEEFNPQPPMYQGFSPIGNYYNQPINSTYVQPQPVNYVAPAQPVEHTATVQPVGEAVPNSIYAPITPPTDERIVEKTTETKPIVETVEEIPEEYNTETE